MTGLMTASTVPLPRAATKLPQYRPQYPSARIVMIAEAT